MGDVARGSVGCGKQYVYATCEGKVLRKEDELKSCGVRDGSTVQIVSRLRGGGKHKDKKSQKVRRKNRRATKVQRFRSATGT